MSVFGDEPELDQALPELASVCFLLFQRLGELIGRDVLRLEKELA